ncbi:MAG: hypothetical protein V3S67_07595, partial [Gammaproteobacteria bacterium]
MNLDRLNQFIQIAANFGVILSITFLAFELSQNREMMKAQTRHEMSQGIVDLLLTEATNPELNRILNRGLSGEEITGVELERLEIMMNAYFRYWEDVHYQYRAGLYDDSEFSRQKQSWAYLLTSRSALEHWCVVRDRHFEAFAMEMDSLL